MKTPPIPQWISELSHPAYENIYSFDLGQPNLWGTETLLGDWGGRFLLVAQDFYPSSWIKERLHLPNPYSHNPNAPTNRNLLKTLKSFEMLGESSAPESCNFLYISACFLMRADGRKRGPLPNASEVLSISAPVVSFTMDNMPNLSSIVLMGSKAAAAFRISGNSERIQSRKLKIFKVNHPACAMRDEDRLAQWRPVFSGVN